MENKSPPMGAPKAAAKPAADPILTKSRRSESVEKCDNSVVTNDHSSSLSRNNELLGKNRNIKLEILLRLAPKIAPMCTNGPSGPTAKPDETEAMVPKILTSKRRPDAKRLTRTPFK